MCLEHFILVLETMDQGVSPTTSEQAEVDSGDYQLKDKRLGDGQIREHSIWPVAISSH